MKILIIAFSFLTLHGYSQVSKGPVDPGLKFKLSYSITSDKDYKEVYAYNPLCGCYTIWNMKSVPAKGLFCDTTYDYEESSVEIAIFSDGIKMVHINFHLDSMNQYFTFYYDTSIKK